MKNHIRRVRIEKGMTLQGLSEKLGIVPSTLSRIETGKIEVKVSVLKELAAALDCDWRELVED